MMPVMRRSWSRSGMLALACLVVILAVVRWVTSSPGSGTPELGVYMPGNNSGLDAYTSDWPVQPNIASFYLSWDSEVPALMRTYAAQGREIQVRLGTKSIDGSYVAWTGIAGGHYDSDIVALIKSLDALGVRVLVSLDSEPDAQYDAPHDAGGSDTPGVMPGQTPAQYVAAANHFADLIHANSTHVESLVWLAGFKDAATSASFIPAHSKLDNIGWDPYETRSYAAGETPTQLFATFIDTVLVPYGYGDIPRHITETGIVTGRVSVTLWTADQQIEFWQSIPGAMTADDIESVVWFRDNSGRHDYIPTDPSVDRAFSAMVASALS